MTARLQHLSFPCHPEASSLHRQAVLNKYVAQYISNQHSAGDIVVQAISDTSDSEYPVYRNGQPPDYLATSATGRNTWKNVDPCSVHIWPHVLKSFGHFNGTHEGFVTHPFCKGLSWTRAYNSSQSANRRKWGCTLIHNKLLNNYT